MFCKNCGAEVNEKDITCPNCGAILSDQHYAKKWYNVKTKLWLSILFWPLFLYGAYKTQILTRKTKWIITGCITVLCIVGILIPTEHKESNSTSPTEQSDQPPVDQAYAQVKVESFIKDGLRDPDSYESVSWGQVTKNSDGTSQIAHTYRAKNGFGGYDVENKTFIISRGGVTGAY